MDKNAEFCNAFISKLFAFWKDLLFLINLNVFVLVYTYIVSMIDIELMLLFA